jgi:TonB family protein
MRTLKSLMILVMMVFLFMTIDVFASGDILVHFNFYEGIRQKEKTLPAVVSSYFLKPLEKNHLLFNTRQNKQKTNLKRVYNLKEVKSLLHVQWIWRQGETAKKFQPIVLNGHEFQVQLTLTAKKREDGFRLQVLEKIKDKSKKILGTEITLPQENTAVFGFEDSMAKIYFLSFFREKNQESTGDTPMDVSHQRVPELIKRVDPVYPAEAVSKEIEGTVIMEVVVDTKGNVSGVKVTGGAHKILNDAAVQAVKQWKYQPYLVNGKAKPVKFTVVLDFYFY